MEIKGEEFIKKVQLKQEKNEIEQRLNEIKNEETLYQETEQESKKTIPPNLDKEVEIQEEQEYSDIMLSNSSNNELNKKKYLVLGLVLVILFLLTIIIIRLLTNDDSSNNSFSKNKEQNAQQVLDSENIEEQYQKIINEKLKNIKEENDKFANENDKTVDKNENDKTVDKVDEKLDLQKIEEQEKVVEKKKSTKTDVFDVKEKESDYKPTKITKKEPVKPKPVKVEKKEIKKVTQKIPASITTKPEGTFVQVGAFSKMPNDKYLQGIVQKGFKYKVYKVSINNKLFHKVLIGPYNSKGQAKLAIDDIKKKLNISGAFILTF